MIINFKLLYKLKLLMILGLFINACSSSSAENEVVENVESAKNEIIENIEKTPTEKTIEAYLTAVVNDNKQIARELFCTPMEYSAYLIWHSYRLNAFDILDVETKSLKNSDFEYDEVYVKQDITKRNKQQEQEKSYSVWDTDTHYHYMTKKYQEYYKNPDIQMDRAKWSSSSKCIAKDSDISTSYYLLPLKNLNGFSSEPEDSSAEKSEMYQEYRQIEIGMDLDEVKAMLEEYSVEEKISNNQASYIWTIPEGKHLIIVRFINNKVKSKSMRYY